MARISASRLSAWFLRSPRVAMQVAGDLLHFLGQQRRAIDLEHPQHALHLVQVRPQRSSSATFSGCST